MGSICRDICRVYPQQNYNVLSYLYNGNPYTQRDWKVLADPEDIY